MKIPKNKFEIKLENNFCGEIREHYFRQAETSEFGLLKYSNYLNGCILEKISFLDSYGSLKEKKEELLAMFISEKDKLKARDILVCLFLECFYGIKNANLVLIEELKNIRKKYFSLPITLSYSILK